MGCSQSKTLKCPKCRYKFVNSEDIVIHLQEQHHMQNMSCPKCELYGFKDVDHLLDHVVKSHEMAQRIDTTVTCPKCNKHGFKDAISLYEHYESDHFSIVTRVASAKQDQQLHDLPPVESYPQESNIALKQEHNNQLRNKALPRVGDKVLAMWSLTPWQYFHATVRKFIPSEVKFEIDWDDPDPTGRIVDYFHLAIDKSPNSNEVSIGSIVLFPQGEYVGGPNGGIYGGVRWHQGRITKVHDIDGTRLFDGCHTKGEYDGKWITYSGYNYTFHRLKLEALRVGPNVFDILDDNHCANDTLEDDIDIYFSYVVSDSPRAIRNSENVQAPQKYLPILDKLCDPRDIAENLKKEGLKIGMREAANGEELKQTAVMMKQAKVFIACISDEYVANDECRMEFQYAKTTLNRPVVPLVVGDGSFDWTVSVVGMLIAGELYIHFKDKNVESNKYTELLSALKSHFKTITDVTDSPDAEQKGGSVDVFLSYNWRNSFMAKEASQVNETIGSKFADPRLIKAEMEKAGFKVWLDIERLQSANASAGMYEQLTMALKSAQVVVPCVSSEYANSTNCRMEFQFAVKTLQKPIIPLVVGEGDEWKASVIGSLVNNGSNKPIDLQGVKSHGSLSKRLKPTFDQIKQLLGTTATKPPAASVIRPRAPKLGDHVVSHHMDSAYYMATVAAFSYDTLEYTVDWDDGDDSGRVQPYDQVALDTLPDPEDIAVGSIILFSQGTYECRDASNAAGGQRYHEGIVTSCRMVGSSKLVTGHHTKGENNGKLITYEGYSYTFTDCPLENIRIPPSAMDVMLAAKS